MTYNENIERLSRTSRFNTSEAQRHETNNAQAINAQRARDISSAVDGLSAFSQSLQKHREEAKKRALKEGAAAARQFKQADSLKLAALQSELQTVKEDDIRYQELKAEMLKLSGPNIYPDADRLAKLSPWAQVGYAKEKLRNFNDSFADQLAFEMQNSNKALSLQGFNFTAKELRENNIQGLPFKEAAVEVLALDLMKAAGIDKFSPEMRELAGTNEAIQNAKDKAMGKYRERYNISASNQTRIQAALSWQNSPRTGIDLHQLILTNAGTVDKNGQILGNVGGWSETMKLLTSEGVQRSDPGYADTIGNIPLPPELLIKVGAKPGTTFAQQWPNRFRQLKADIKDGYIQQTDNELKFQKAAGKDLEAQFIEEARQGNLSTAQVNEYKAEFGNIGLPVPSGVTNYETLSMRDQREDKQSIEALMASQNGYISQEQLDQFNPQAALEFREKAAKLEKAALSNFDAEKKIKSYLDTAFTNMGIKGNEKSPAYVEAMANAKADYAKKYNMYVGMGYEPEVASHLALHAKEVKTEDGKPIPNSMGVLTEIRENGEKSKYVITGQSIAKELPAGTIRVARIASGKREMLEDPNIIFKGTIGGDYGRRQLDSVIANIEKHGTQKGLNLDKGAIEYYKGLARGRDGNWMGLLDAQLKARGHEGLWPKGRPEVISLLEGKDENGEDILDPEVVAIMQAISRSANYPSKSTYLYNRNLMKDGSTYGQSLFSTFDDDENLIYGLRD